MEPELVCIDSVGKSSGMGVIKGGGYVIHTSCSLARRYDMRMIRLIVSNYDYCTVK